MMSKLLLRIIIICCILLPTTTHSYWWRLSNFTDKIILLKCTLKAHHRPYYAIVFPAMSTLFDWSIPHPLAGFCLDKIEWTQAPQAILANKNLIDKNYMVIDNKKMNALVKEMEITFTRARIQYFTSDLYEQTVRYASAVAPKKLVQWAAKTHAHSVCKSRYITIVENIDGDILFLTQES